MVRINLLPPEIIERRKWERWYPYVFVVAGVLLALVVFTWLGLQFFASQRSGELQQREQQVVNLQRDAERLAIFEQQAAALQKRQGVVHSALDGRIDMGRVLEEVSLVLPDSVWLRDLILSEEGGAEFRGFTPEVEEPQIGEGYKSIAATLVRLNSLEALWDVWLSVAESGEYADFQGDDAEGQAQVVEFEITSKISSPSTSTAQSAVPAPPAPAGQ